MNVLTDEEKGAIARSAGITDADDGAMVTLLFALVEAAVIRKLAAGVSVEPVDGALLDDMVEGSHPSYGRGLFTTDNCITPLYTATAIAAARVQENERCAKVCEELSPDQVLNPRDSSFFDVTTLACSEAITRLLGKEST